MKVINHQHYRTHDVAFTDAVNTRDYRYEIRAKWEAVDPSSGFNAIKLKNSTVLYQFSDVSSSCLILEINDVIISIEDYIHNSEVTVQAQGNTFAKAQGAVEAIKKLIPVAPEPRSSEISVRFWYLSPNGPKAVHRNIAAPEWTEITPNYASTTKSGLSHLMEDFKPTSGGQLILWHGEPGTGKTYALRALCQSWKKWCSVEYIMDPETLLGASPGYLASMIMSDTPYDEEVDEDDRPWKLLIMEDTGELLTYDARQRSGQGLSRLLNVVDGFIGQGLRVMVLITTNEEFDKLHPAVSREGRCAASIKFEGLNPDEATAFLKSKGVSTQIDKHKLTNLSDLFALTKTGEMPRDVLGVSSTSIGFRVPTLAK